MMNAFNHFFKTSLNNRIYKLNTETCPSGLWWEFAKFLRCQSLHRFESCSFRHYKIAVAVGRLSSPDGLAVYIDWYWWVRVPRFYRMEWCVSGWNGLSRKQKSRKVPRVRIPVIPPNLQGYRPMVGLPSPKRITRVRFLLPLPTIHKLL